ncbi:hypothetical protein F2Q69_00046755 [Brassica cretica]|uniref:Uncharacterized protein n=1 Tax=Brassica cretica TaxID=69181 RepID=A0A8S9Q0V8_BRACR|nr:hypothetical protein F2Q69_00046755 [Brassica cretica]
MDKMCHECKGKSPLPFQLIPTAHLIPLVYSPCLQHSNGHIRKDNSRPHIAHHQTKLIRVFGRTGWDVRSMYGLELVVVELNGGLRLLHLNWMDQMSQGCKVDCTVDGTDLLSVPLALSLYVALSSFLVAPRTFMDPPRPYKAVQLALALHLMAFFSLTPPKPSHDQSKSFLELTSQDNYFRTLLKLD